MVDTGCLSQLAEHISRLNRNCSCTLVLRAEKASAHLHTAAGWRAASYCCCGLGKSQCSLTRAMRTGLLPVDASLWNFRYIFRSFMVSFARPSLSGLRARSCQLWFLYSSATLGYSSIGGKQHKQATPDVSARDRGYKGALPGANTGSRASNASVSCRQLNRKISS